MKKFITAIDLLNFAKCPHRPFMDFNGDPTLKVEIHPLVKLLWESGVQYEAKVLESLKKQNPNKTVVSMDTGEPLSQDLFFKTVEAMRSGIDYIYQGVLIQGRFAGQPDLLVKTAGFSDFGDYHYVPMDIKLPRIEGTWDDGSEKVPKEQQWQALFYGDLLEKIQGFRPAYGYIYKTKSRKLSVNLLRKNDLFEKALENLLIYQDSEHPDSRPAFSSNCKMCEWKSVCKKWIDEKNDCTQVYYVGSAMQKGFYQLGIQTVDDLSRQDPEELKIAVRDLKTKGYFWKTLPDDLVEKSVARARLLQSGSRGGVPVIYSPIHFSKSRFEIHYDLEDDPTQDFVYLHGLLLVEEGKKPEYHAFFAESLGEEKKITETLFEFLRKYPDAPVYHYSPYEKTTLQRLLKKYSSLNPEVFNRIFGEGGTSVDLLKTINDQTDWPLSSYSIKDICRYLGFQWEASDASGSSSIVWMNDYLNGKKDLKNKILRYNQDDCMASYFLKESLIKMQEG